MGHQSRMRAQRRESLSMQGELDRATDKLALRMLADVAENATEMRPDGRVVNDWAARQAAATEIARRTGILPAVRAIARGGPLDIPPPWPKADICAMSGGPGYLDVAVRTMHQRKGRVESLIRMQLPPGTKPTQDQIGVAYERGLFHLKRKIAE